MPDGWCFDCHNPDNRDKLRLANGKLVKFEESYILCGQCHGTILREWKAGLHGKRTGMWNGDKAVLSLRTAAIGRMNRGSSRSNRFRRR